VSLGSEVGDDEGFLIVPHQPAGGKVLPELAGEVLPELADKILRSSTTSL